MDNPMFNKAWVVIGIKIASAALLLIFLAAASRAYQAEYLLAKAEAGRKPLSEYDSLLHKAWESDPYNNAVSLRYGRRLLASGKLERAQTVLENSASGQNHWQAWELQGMIMEKQAFSEAGVLEEGRKAQVLYERMLNVYPTYVPGLERISLLGLKLGNWALVDSAASRLVTLDQVSNNGTYLKARAAQGIGNSKLAHALYTSLSADGKPTTRSLFSTEEIIRRIQGELP